jgi:hypothetical protein
MSQPKAAASTQTFAPPMRAFPSVRGDRQSGPAMAVSRTSAGSDPAHGCRALRVSLTSPMRGGLPNRPPWAN